jgi:hypothetical protein
VQEIIVRGSVHLVVETALRGNCGGPNCPVRERQVEIVRI